jgi:hypothetical protein
VRVRNAPQFTVNVIALAIGLAGIWKAVQWLLYKD